MLKSVLWRQKYTSLILQPLSPFVCLFCGCTHVFHLSRSVSCHGGTLSWLVTMNIHLPLLANFQGKWNGQLILQRVLDYPRTTEKLHCLLFPLLREVFMWQQQFNHALRYLNLCIFLRVVSAATCMLSPAIAEGRGLSKFFPLQNLLYLSQKSSHYLRHCLRWKCVNLRRGSCEKKVYSFCFMCRK